MQGHVQVGQLIHLSVVQVLRLAPTCTPLRLKQVMDLYLKINIIGTTQHWN